MVIPVRPSWTTVLRLIWTIVVSQIAILFYQEELLKLTIFHQEEISKLNTLHQKKMKEKEEEIWRLKERLRTFEEQSTTSESKESHDDMPPLQNRPFLLQGRVRAAMDRLVFYLDATTFSRFIRMSKEMYYLASNGILRKEVDFNCVPVVNYNITHNGNLLGLRDVHHLKNSPWFVPKIQKVTIGELDEFNMDESVVDPAVDFTDTLDFIKTKDIGHLQINSDIDIQSILEKYRVHSLRAYGFTDVRFMRSDIVKQIPKVHFDFESIGDEERREINSLTRDFVLNGNSAEIAMYFVSFPLTFIVTLSKAWVSGQRRFNWINLGRYLSEEELTVDDLVSALHNAFYYDVKKVDYALQYIAVDDFKRMDVQKPAIVRGTDQYAIVQREDGCLLRVYFSEDTVILKAMQ